MKLPKFINSIVAELERLGQIHQELREDGFCELVDMYFKKAMNLYNAAAAQSDKEAERRLRQEGGIAVQAMHRSAEAAGIPIALYDRLVYSASLR